MIPPGAPDAMATVTLGELPLARAWNVKGDPRGEAFVAEASRVFALRLPVDPMTSTRDDDEALLWLGPRSWLYISFDASRHGDFDAARRAINAARGALFDVSASYVAWRIDGAAAARVLNRACPLDLHSRAFPPGHCAQSVLGHINALFYKPNEAPSFVVLVARSFAADAAHTLREAARSDGHREPK